MARMGIPASAGSLQCPDRPCGFVAIQDRHLNIHQHQIIITGAGGYDLLHCLGAVFRRLDPEAIFTQKLGMIMLPAIFSV